MKQCKFCNKQIKKNDNWHQNVCQNNPNKRLQHYNKGRKRPDIKIRFDKNGKINCTYCNQLFCVSNIKYHQRYCDKNPDKKQKPKNKPIQKKQCKFCNQSFSFIFNHQPYCDKNPDKKSQHFNSGLNNGMNKQNYDYSIAGSCKFCNKSYNVAQVKYHQTYCEKNPNKEKYWADGTKLSPQHRKKSSARLQRFRDNGGVAHGIPHTQQTKIKNRIRTTKQITNGQIKRTSKGQMQLYEYIKTINENRQLQFNRKYYAVDIAIQKLKLRFQYYGDFWHRNPQMYNESHKLYDSQKRNLKNDKTKKSYLLNKGWTLKIIWQKDWKEKKQQIKQEVKCLICLTQQKMKQN